METLPQPLIENLDSLPLPAYDLLPMDEYGKNGKIAWVYRHYPLEQIHSSARRAAAGAECAAKLGGEESFWKYVNKIFTANEVVSTKLIDQATVSLGLDASAFQTCLEKGEIHERIDRDIKDGVSAGVRGTPHTIVVAKNGKQFIINGAQPYEVVKATIEQALQEK